MKTDFKRWLDSIDNFFYRLDASFNAMNVSSTDVAEKNFELYRDIVGENYNSSFVNPKFAGYLLGEDVGKLCAFISAECYAMIGFKFDRKSSLITPFTDMCRDIKNIYEKEDITYDFLYKRIYKYLYEASDIFTQDRIADMLLPRDSASKKIVMGNHGDVSYLYKYGEYITENEIKTARFLNLLSQEKINKMARTFTEGYRRGFIAMNRPFEKKKTVGIIYKIGFERLVKAEMVAFRDMGLETTLFRAPSSAVMGATGKRSGFYAASPNKQAEYDHMKDAVYFYDEKLVERKLKALRLAYEKYADAADVYGGPAVMEVFGEKPFDYEENEDILVSDEKQKALETKLSTNSGMIANEFIKGEERSFTIIAYPTPEIGPDYKNIFNDTILINTLDNDVYTGIQQSIIDVLNTAKNVVLRGKNGNLTDISVSLKKAEDPKRQEIFENCVADVNIPVGEVFTTPVLKGTNGVLFVKKVFLQGFEYRDLKIVFEDGMVKDYSCSNFESAEKGKEYFKKNVLHEFDSLPIGEFAIGTNTTAHAMARKYNIENLLPILISEKTGPHFALGDTCYSHSEDVIVFNPSGKEIIAKDNEISIKRKENPQKAYFNCHTDITIPYEEIESLTAIGFDGSKVDIIRDGKFVLAGTEALNVPLK